MRNLFVDTQLRAANEQLALAEAQIDAAIDADSRGEPSAGALDGASGSLKIARRCIDELSQRSEAETVAMPSLRACPACGRSIRLEATLCGYCWTRV